VSFKQTFYVWEVVIECNGDEEHILRSDLRDNPDQLADPILVKTLEADNTVKWFRFKAFEFWILPRMFAVNQQTSQLSFLTCDALTVLELELLDSFSEVFVMPCAESVV